MLDLWPFVSGIGEWSLCGDSEIELPPGEWMLPRSLVAQVVEPATLFLVSYTPHSDQANGIANCKVLKVIYRPRMGSWPGWEQGTPKWHYPPRLVSLSAGTVFLSFPLQCWLLAVLLVFNYYYFFLPSLPFVYPTALAVFNTLSLYGCEH